jgi:hypothetical protein
MMLHVGTTVTRSDRPTSQHGLVVEVGQQSVTVSWHKKESGLDMGKVYEDPKVLLSDPPCRFCKL